MVLCVWDLLARVFERVLCVFISVFLFNFRKTSSCTTFNSHHTDNKKSSSTEYVARVNVFLIDINLFRSFDSETDIFSKPKKVRKQIKMNLVQLKIDWISLPNIRNGAYLGKITHCSINYCNQWINPRTFISDVNFIFAFKQQTNRSVFSWFNV